MGGLFLTLAGYPLTGLSVVLASLETIRGGIYCIIDHCESAIREHKNVGPATRKSLRLGTFIFGWYIRAIKLFAGRFKKTGLFIDTRPFLTGALIKAPLRLEFVAKKALAGDVAGVIVGLSWMILGDGGLALNDPALKAQLKRYSQS